MTATGNKKHYFLSGIGGSGMMPLAYILKGRGHRVSGSDRGRDQGRSPEKFARLEVDGFALHPQDGSGVHDIDALVVSAAVEDTVPDVKAARDAGVSILKRAELLAEIFNAFPRRIAVGGTSGKTTTTGMIAYILKEAGLDPTVMCGGVMKNYGVTALAGKGDVFVTECDESDGSIALYDPDVAVLTNISVDHKGLDELRALFSHFVARARVPVVNADNAESARLIGPGARSFSLHDSGRDYATTHVYHLEEGTAAVVNGVALSLDLPGEHNLSNALAAIAAAEAYGIGVEKSCDILARFQGIKRRMEWVGEAGGVAVIDDFAHNPDKIAATLSTLRRHPGRLLVIFQMHGYGPLKLMWRELAETFRTHTDEHDCIYMPDPLYLGGTADRAIGTKQVCEAIGPRAHWCETRDACGLSALLEAQPGDRIVVMGARDDTLSDFASGLLESLKKKAA
ncbi:MAG: UDP-N-acetylmuramate--alanine ligase [Rhodospirillales bacterium]|nr:UDP-N-acetylmuramate--alanine ligase [Rhodospirillales bacterium]USO07540.1 MAG: UDP-N-acetylmuramate--alanine ligase [Rhodospirillales bacterium]